MQRDSSKQSTAVASSKTTGK